MEDSSRCGIMDPCVLLKRYASSSSKLHILQRGEDFMITSSVNVTTVATSTISIS